MPQLQVLQREADPQENQIVKSMQQAQENLRAERQAQAYLWQVKQMAKNAENDIDKMKYERKHNALKELLELKKAGLGEIGFQKYLEVFGEDGMDAMHALGEEIAKAKSPADELKSAQTGALEAFSQGGATGEPPPINDISEGGQAMPAPRRTLAPQAAVAGVTLVNPQDTAAVEEIKTTARNVAERASRMPTAEEQKTVGFADAVIRNTDDALSRIDSLKGNVITGTLKRAAVDAQNPIAAGAAVEPLQGDINRLRNIIIYLRSGAQINDQEAARLSQLLQVSGKTTGQIKKDLNEFKADAVLRRALVEGGAPVLQNKQYQSPSMTNTVGRFTIREKK